MSILETIIRMKRSINPKTRKLFTWREIGKEVNLTAPACHNRIKPLLKDHCPNCLHRIKQESK